MVPAPRMHGFSPTCARLARLLRGVRSCKPVLYAQVLEPGRHQTSSPLVALALDTNRKTRLGTLRGSALGRLCWRSPGGSLANGPKPRRRVARKSATKSLGPNPDENWRLPRARAQTVMECRTAQRKVLTAHYTVCKHNIALNSGAPPCNPPKPMFLNAPRVGVSFGCYFVCSGLRGGVIQGVIKLTLRIFCTTLTPRAGGGGGGETLKQHPPYCSQARLCLDIRPERTSKLLAKYSA